MISQADIMEDLLKALNSPKTQLQFDIAAVILFCLSFIILV